jgi:hypothetical protein
MTRSLSAALPAALQRIERVEAVGEAAERERVRANALASEMRARSRACHRTAPKERTGLVDLLDLYAA